jgi:hypothetical protein
MSKWEMIREFALAMFLATLLIVFGTNAVTDDWNIWALMVRFGS